MARSRRQPTILYGLRLATLRDLEMAVEDIKARAARLEAEKTDVELEGEIRLIQEGDGSLCIEIDVED